jgi:hypothetical protein
MPSETGITCWHIRQKLLCSDTSSQPADGLDPVHSGCKATSMSAIPRASESRAPDGRLDCVVGRFYPGMWRRSSPKDKGRKGPPLSELSITLFRNPCSHCPSSIQVALSMRKGRRLLLRLRFRLLYRLFPYFRGKLSSHGVLVLSEDFQFVGCKCHDPPSSMIPRFILRHSRCLLALGKPSYASRDISRLTMGRR